LIVVARIRCAFAVVVALLLLFPGLAASAEAARRPNIIILLADDLGYADLGFQGSKDIVTPHLDALARGGIRCTDGYVSCPVCSPTRAGLLTGRSQQRFGYEFIGGGGKQVVGLPVAEKTMADLLKAAGYATGAIGKWHLGKEPQFHPLTRGFRELYGFLGGGRSYFPAKAAAPLAPLDPLLRGRDQVEDPPYLTDAFGQEAAAFIQRHKREPFFLYVAFNAPHVPLEAPANYLKRFASIANKGRRTYAAMVGALDDAVGRITQKLHAEGLEGDTLIFFLSDNGGHLGAGARNNPLRGQKGTLYEGGIRVPFVVKWTGQLRAGTTYAQPVSSLDILATGLSAAGVALPRGRRYDSVDLLPHLRGKTDRPAHEALFWRYGDHHAVRSGVWKLTVPAVEPAGLYDLSNDRGEAKDLSAAEPERLRKLTRLYEAWNAQLPPPAWPPNFLEKGARRPAPPKSSIPEKRK
jgi:arylsulfatase A-like enzyme